MGCADPSMNMKQMAKDLKVNRETLRLAIREDLCLIPYKHRITQLVPEKGRALRVIRGRKLLKHHEENPDKVNIWTDEKSWFVDSAKNQQNDRFLAYCRDEVPDKHRSTKPVSAMMLGVVGSDGQVMPPLWMEKGAKVDSKIYIANLEKVKVWLDETYTKRGKKYVFMQDGAPSHTSEKTITWMEKNFPDFWRPEEWPPYSPDCNPLDFNIWGFVERKACALPHSSVAALQESVNRAWGELLTEEHVKKTCASAWKRIDLMIKAKGYPFEPGMKKNKN